MRIPEAIALYKQALPLTFPGLAIGGDLSNRTSVASATTLYTIWYDPVTGKNRRSSAADGLLWAPKQQRTKLVVLATHTVDRVLFNRDVTATGVSFLPTNGSVPSSKTFSAYATKGVILSAGSLATAPILERSGIGRSDVLKSARIRKMVDLPGVGANLNVRSLSFFSPRILCSTYPEQDQPGAAAYALVSAAYQNKTSIIDNRSFFAPEISLVNLEELWGTSKRQDTMSNYNPHLANFPSVGIICRQSHLTKESSLTSANPRRRQSSREYMWC